MNAPAISRHTAAALSTLPREAFVGVLGGVFEHSPWIAAAVWEKRPFASVERLHRALCEVVASAGEAAQVALIEAHPELAGKAAVRGALTAASRDEQRGAGLDQCTPAEFESLRRLNRDYRDTFGFPFILAIRGYDRAGIIANLRGRLGNTRAAERAEKSAADLPDCAFAAR